MSGSSLIDLQALPRLHAALTDKVYQLARSEAALATPNEEVSDRVTLLREMSYVPSQTSFSGERGAGQGKRGWIDARMIACFASMLVSGWSDATAGPLLPAIEAFYGISYSRVSLLFISQASGFLLASLIAVHMTAWLGEGKLHALSAVFHLCGFALIIPALPFALFCVAYVLIGFGEAGLISRTNGASSPTLQLSSEAQAAYVAGMPSAAEKMGILQAFYGLGAVLTPITATALVSANVRWSLAYAIPLSLAVINTVLIVYGFRLERDAPPPASITGEGEPLISEDSSSKLRRILRDRTTITYSLFLAIYVGMEVSAGGWSSSYLINERNGGSGSGYVASGFWGGVCIGRLIFPAVSTRFGEWRSIIVFLSLAALFQGLVWAIPSFYGSAICFSVTGLLISHTYSTAVSIATKLIPRSLHGGAVGFMASTGQIGAALFPFFVGILSQRYGIVILQPALIVMLALMVGTWLIAPHPTKDRE